MFIDQVNFWKIKKFKLNQKKILTEKNLKKQHIRKKERSLLRSTLCHRILK